MKKKIFISAAEYSGDLLAADLIKSLSTISDTFEFYGVCGPQMEKTKTTKLFDI